MSKIARYATRFVVALVATASLSACGIMSCEEYTSYGDILDTWVGSDIRQYESRNSKRPLSSMDRPRNTIQYEYNTPYVNYDGSRMYCKTWMEVDRDSGKILAWHYEGDCHMHGRCSG